MFLDFLQTNLLLNSSIFENTVLPWVTLFENDYLRLFLNKQNQENMIIKSVKRVENLSLLVKDNKNIGVLID